MLALAKSLSESTVRHNDLQGTVNSTLASLTIASDRKSSTLVLPQVTLRDTAMYYCVLRGRIGPDGAASVQNLWWEEGGTQWGSSQESKSRVI